MTTGRARYALALLAATALIATAATGAGADPPGQPGAHPRSAYFVSKSYAELVMKKALNRHEEIGYSYGTNREVHCNKRVAIDRVRCKMSWNNGSSRYVSGHGMIWMTYDSYEPFWNYSYRIRSVDYFCLEIGGSDCEQTHVVR